MTAIAFLGTTDVLLVGCDSDFFDFPFGAFDAIRTAPGCGEFGASDAAETTETAPGFVAGLDNLFPFEGFERSTEDSCCMGIPILLSSVSRC